MTSDWAACSAGSGGWQQTLACLRNHCLQTRLQRWLQLKQTMLYNLHRQRWHLSWTLILRLRQRAGTPDLAAAAAAAVLVRPAVHVEPALLT
jgi:hypothetical protein